MENYPVIIQLVPKNLEYILDTNLTFFEWMPSYEKDFQGLDKSNIIICTAILHHSDRSENEQS